MDLVTQSEAIRDEVMERLHDIIGSARYILGKEVQEFETLFAEYCQSDHGIGVANGSDALVLALKALDIGAGDEVITAANSFAATAFAIAHAGATPVFVDIDPSDFNMAPHLIEDAITDKTKAIMPVHLYGQPAKMAEILEIAKRHDLRVIEDAAQAHGAEIDGQRCGSFGDIGCFSFYPGKNLGAFGDGGAVVTNDETVAERIRMLRNYGQREKNRHDELAVNSRLDTVQAAVLLTKMKYIESWTENRRRVATWYREALEGTALELPSVRDEVRHVYHLFVIRHPKRDQLAAHLKEQGIFCGIHYPRPLFHAKPLEHCRTVPMNCPETCSAADEILSLPMCPEVTEDQVQRIAAAIRSFAE